MDLSQSANATTLLDAWKHDADEFGLPENAQKGLIFLIALGMRVDPNLQEPIDLLTQARKLCSEISLTPPHIPEGLGGDFYDGLIEEVLTELAERALAPFESRQIDLSSGENLKVWKRGAEDRLPTCLGSETSLLSDWDDIMTSLCGLIGDQINDDLEEAFVDGFLFFDSYYPMDVQGTIQISRIATAFLPPHLMWFEHCLNFDPELVSRGNPVQKVLQCFLGSEDASIVPKVLKFSDDIHYCAPGQKRRAVWEADLSLFTVTAGVAQTHLDEATSESWFAPARQELLGKEFKTPRVCTSYAEIAEVLQEQVYDKWGYDILEEEQCPCLGAQYTRRACISLLCVANGILQPTWNHFARS